MNNSTLVTYTKISPNKNIMSDKKNKKITIHHMAGFMSVQECGNLFAQPSRQASSNYGIDNNGNVGLYVEEKDRAWTSGSRENDCQAVTIEVANCKGAPNWEVSDAAYNKLIDLCVDICKRNNIKELVWTGDKTGTLTCHYMFAATACPGPYLKSKMTEIAQTVNARLKGTSTTDSSSITAGKQIMLNNAPVYSSETGVQIGTKTGSFYLWDTTVRNNRIRITNAASRVGVKGQVTCWVDISSFGNTAATSSNTSKPSSASSNMSKPSSAIVSSKPQPDTFSMSKPSIIYKVKTADGKWLPEVKNNTDYAGIENRKITAFACKLSDGTPLKYRTHLTNGRWLGWVTGYNTADYYNGYAGDDKTPIDAIEIKCEKYTIRYKVSSVNNGAAYYGTVSSKTVTGNDSYAGVFGKPVDKIMCWL